MQAAYPLNTCVLSADCATSAPDDSPYTFEIECDEDYTGTITHHDDIVDVA